MVRRYPLTEDSACRIGRGAQNTIALVHDVNVSRNHAMVQRMDEHKYYLSDLGSRNGTLLNDRPVVVPALLRHGDRITVASNEFVFHQPGRAQATTSSSREFSRTHLHVARRMVSVLVLDIRGYSQLSQQVDQAELTRAIGTLFEEAGRALTEKGCWAQKYIGDAVMGAWVHRAVTPDWSDLLAVFDGLNAVAQIVQSLHTRFNLPEHLRVGAGINTGYAATGNMGSVAVADFTVLGDVVNKAFRLETCTKEIGYEIAVGQQTYEFLNVAPGVSTLFHQVQANLKGYQDPEPVYGMPWENLGTLLKVVRDHTRPKR
jgi:adenylate cyclase